MIGRSSSWVRVPLALLLLALAAAPAAACTAGARTAAHHPTGRAAVNAARGGGSLRAFAAAEAVARPTLVRNAGAADRLRESAPGATGSGDRILRDTIPGDTIPGDTIPGDTIPAGDAIPGDTIPGDTTGARAVVPAAVDSVLTRLRALEGYVATEYAGDSAVYRASTGVLRLRGNAQVTREGSVLTAQDSIVYRDEQQLVEAHGRPTVSGEAQELEGEVLFYDLARDRATALAARTKVTQNATWYVEGDVTLEQTERVYATGGRFTTDDRPEPQYHFQSDRIKVVRDRVLVAAPARLFFGKVPVLWLPFIVQDLERGRRSGILAPEFGINDIVRNSSGHVREISNVGFYWAMNDYLGAQLAGSWRSGTYTSLRSTLDWNWRRQFLRGSAAVQQYWQPGDSKQLTVRGSSSWKPNERTDLAVSADYASSSRFIQETSTDPLQSTQELASSLKMNRRFDWGQLALGGSRRQRISDGSVTATLPSFSINPNTITLFRAPSASEARWYNNASLQLGLTGDRSMRSGQTDFDRLTRDEETLRLNGGLEQLAIGNLTLSATGSVNERLMLGATGVNAAGDEVTLEEEFNDEARWRAGLSYRIPLIGQTSISPNLSMSQELKRDALTGPEYLGAPVRVALGVGTSASLYGFYPGVGPFSAIRHRLTPTVSYAYAPQARQTERQEMVFGAAGGRTSSTVQLSLTQSWEAKLTPRATAQVREEARADSAAAAEADSAGVGTGIPSAPADPEKVTLLSISTSAIGYDFARAAAEGNGFLTDDLTNTITSDFLRGMTIRMGHELFDKSELDQSDPAMRGKLGRFAPRLSSLSTGLTLGPSSGVVRWIQRVLGGAGDATGAEGAAADAARGARRGAEPPGERSAGEEVNPEGTGPATNNPRGAGSGAWRVALNYTFSRPDRVFTRSTLPPKGASQTIRAQSSFALTPNWALNWNTDYSITDREFSTQSLVLRRDLYRWEADFTFSLTPYGNSSFSMVVRLKDLPDLKFDYREPDLSINRGPSPPRGF